MRNSNPGTGRDPAPAGEARRRLHAALIAGLIWVSALWSQTSGPAAPAHDVIADFGTRVSQYLELRGKEAGSPSKASTSSQRLVEQQQQMAARIRGARTGAAQGNIFTPGIAAYFRHQIELALRGPEGEKIRSSLRHSEPVSGLSLRVNDTYPAAVPLQTMPPSLLQRLPLLPKELEYRIVGRDLVLHDIEPNIIVDFISGAIPSP